MDNFSSRYDAACQIRNGIIELTTVLAEFPTLFEYSNQLTKAFEYQFVKFLDAPTNVNLVAIGKLWEELRPEMETMIRSVAQTGG